MFYALAFGRMVGILLAEHRRLAWRRREAYARQVQSVPPVINTLRQRQPVARRDGAKRGW